MACHDDKLTQIRAKLRAFSGEGMFRLISNQKEIPIGWLFVYYKGSNKLSAQKDETR